MAQMNSGSRLQVRPGARMRWMVTMKFSPVKIEEKPAMKAASPASTILVLVYSVLNGLSVSYTHLALLRSLGRLVERIGSEVYGEFEVEARERLSRRDPEDWPLLATALALRCPIWTEDTDFFGCGVATWTSDRVRMYLRE